MIIIIIIIIQFDPKWLFCLIIPKYHELAYGSQACAKSGEFPQFFQAS
jgi:hypothetical protein